MSAPIRLLTLVLAGAAVAGCSRGTQATTTEAKPAGYEAGGPSRQARLEVQNVSTYDMDIFVRSPSSRQQVRLGFAPAGKTTRFTLSPAVLAGAGPVHFEARPIDRQGRAVSSDYALVQPGDVVSLRIPPQ